jgi:hypothetical protein
MAEVTLSSLHSQLEMVIKNQDRVILGQEAIRNEQTVIHGRITDLISVQCPLHSVQIANNTNDLYWLKRFFWIAVGSVVTQFISNIALYRSMEQLITKIHP